MLRNIKTKVIIALMVLSMLLIVPMIVHAELPGSGEGGDGTSGTADTGINFSNSAFLVTLVDQNGNIVSGSQQALVSAGSIPGGQIVNRAGTVSGYSARTSISALWNCYAWDSSKTGSTTYSQSGNGGKIKQWLLTKPCSIDPDCPSNAVYVAVKVCGKDKTALTQEIAAGADYYLLVTNIYWNHLLGTWQSGNSLFWGSQINANDEIYYQRGFLLGQYQHCCKLEANGIWAGLTPLPRKTRYEVSEATGPKNGLGCVAVHMTDNYQVVICIENKSDGSWATEYLSSGIEYNVQNPYQGATFVEGCVNTKKTKEQSASSTYTVVRTNVETGGGVTSYSFSFFLYQS